jgi:hypothetical protein
MIVSTTFEIPARLSPGQIGSSTILTSQDDSASISCNSCSNAFFCYHFPHVSWLAILNAKSLTHAIPDQRHLWNYGPVTHCPAGPSTWYSSLAFDLSDRSAGIGPWAAEGDPKSLLGNSTFQPQSTQSWLAWWQAKLDRKQAAARNQVRVPKHFGQVSSCIVRQQI